MGKGSAFLVTAGGLLLLGCGGGGGSPSQPVTPADDPLFDECVSTVPVDAGNPNQPVIVLTGPRAVNQSIGTPYIDAGATATDPKDGDLTNRIVVSGLTTLNTNTLGDYMIRYNVKDSANLRAVEAVRIVRVNDGTLTTLTARDISSTSAHLGYNEHLPVHYGDDPNQKFPLIVFQHGWGRARFLNAYTQQAPLSSLANVNFSGLIRGSYGNWDTSRPFIVLEPQSCLDALTYVVTAARMKLFIDYAINTYQVDPTRIYMGGHSQGSGNTWDYVNNYPQQLAAVFPISGGYGSSVGCALKNTPAWAFNGAIDTTVPYQNQVDTVNSINACNPVERAKVTIVPGAGHDDAETDVLTLSALGQGMPQYDIYDQSIYDWLLNHSRAGDSFGFGPRGVGTSLGAMGGVGDEFAITPEEIVVGEQATLKWSFAGTFSCAASGDWLWARAARGMETVAPAIPGLHNYVLSCVGPGGTVARRAALTVHGPDSVKGYRVAVVALDSYVGRYRLDAPETIVRVLGEHIVVSLEGVQLVAEARGLRVALVAKSDVEFQAVNPAVALTFLGNGTRRCPRIQLTVAGLAALVATRDD
jgi:predicted esterase